MKVDKVLFILLLIYLAVGIIGFTVIGIKEVQHRTLNPTMPVSQPPGDD